MTTQITDTNDIHTHVIHSNHNRHSDHIDSDQYADNWCIVCKDYFLPIPVTNLEPIEDDHVQEVYNNVNKSIDIALRPVVKQWEDGAVNSIELLYKAMEIGVRHGVLREVK